MQIYVAFGVVRQHLAKDISPYIPALAYTHINLIIDDWLTS